MKKIIEYFGNGYVKILPDKLINKRLSKKGISDLIVILISTAIIAGITFSILNSIKFTLNNSTTTITNNVRDSLTQ